MDLSDKQKLKEYSNTQTYPEKSIEKSSLNRREARTYRKGKMTIEKANIYKDCRPLK